MGRELVRKEPTKIMTSATNPEVLAICYAQGWCANSAYMTDIEAEAVTSIGTVFQSNTNITHFEELQYFGITSLGANAFSGCNKMTSIVLPNPIAINGGYVFNVCTKLNNVVLNSGFSITSGNYTFNGCSALTHVTNNSNIPTARGSMGLSYVTTLDSDVYIVYDDHLYKQDGNDIILFDFPRKKTSVSFYQGVTKIGNSSMNANSLTSIALPSGVTTLENSSITSASSLVSLDLPSTLTRIGNYGLSNLTKLTDIYIRATTAPTLGNYAFNAISSATADKPRYLHLPVGATGYSGGQWTSSFVNKGWTILNDL